MSLELEKLSVFSQLSSECQFVLHFNGVIIDANQKALTLCNERNVQIGDSFFSLFPKEMRGQIFSYLSDVIHKLEEIVEEIFIYRDYLHLLYRGKCIDEKIYITVYELTPYRPIQTSFYKSESKLESFILNTLDNAILILGKNSNVIFMNDRCASILGLGSCGKTYWGENFNQLTTNTSIQKVMLETFEDVIKNKQFNERYCYDEEQLYQMQGFYDQEKNETFIIIHDRSYQQKFENLLIYKQQMESVSQISAGVAHELRNPLSVIKGFLQLSKKTGNWDKYYSTVMEEINRMNALLEDFLSVSRKRIEKQHFFPHEVLNSLLYIFQSECALHNIKFNSDIETVDEWVYVNETMMKQVMLNLLRNAIEAYPQEQKSKQFSVIGKREEHYYKIIVQDNGIGMSPDIIEKIGTLFFTTKEKGNGLGLPLCNKIIEDHEGKMTISSKVGEGTTFEISLPLIS